MTTDEERLKAAIQDSLVRTSEDFTENVMRGIRREPLRPAVSWWEKCLFALSLVTVASVAIAALTANQPTVLNWFSESKPIVGAVGVALVFFSLVALEAFLRLCRLQR